MEKPRGPDLHRGWVRQEPLHILAGPGQIHIVDSLLQKSPGPDGTLYILASDDYTKIRKLRHRYPVLLDPSGFRMPSADGSELFEFDDVGRHIKTWDAFTGAQLYQFNLGSNNLLTSVQDSHGNTTTITRDSEGKALSILAPFGTDQSYTMTGLSINADGWLESITNPASNLTSFSYSPPGPYTPA